MVCEQNLFFDSSFVLVFTNGTTFHKKGFSRTCKLRAKKRCTIDH